MRTIINYIRSCFCKHDWEVIWNTTIDNISDGTRYKVKVYRCKKCGYSMKYKSH